MRTVADAQNMWVWGMMNALQLATTQLVTVHTPVVVTRAVVAAMTSAVGSTVSRLYDAIDRAKDTEAEQELDALFIRTDVELIAALISDLSTEADATTSVRVCLDHLHHSLQELNQSLCALDASVRCWCRAWRLTRGSSEGLLRDVSLRKRRLDHHLDRLVQVASVHGGGCACRPAAARAP